MAGTIKANETELQHTQALYNALQEQRRNELERQRELVRERDSLRQELASLLNEGRRRQVGEQQGVLPNVLVRIKALDSAGQSGLADRIIAALLLRYARKAARALEYGRAQIFYQCIALLRPRAFIWKQIGNMLYQQQIYGPATELLQRALKANPADEEAKFLLARCDEQIDD